MRRWFYRGKHRGVYVPPMSVRFDAEMKRFGVKSVRIVPYVFPGDFLMSMDDLPKAETLRFT